MDEELRKSWGLRDWCAPERCIRWSTTSSTIDIPRFPGAVNSPLVTTMNFRTSSDLAPIPTYRVMNSEGYLNDPNRQPPDVSNDQALIWYKNMLTVNILDTIMFEAQRQGRVSAGEEAVTVGSAAALGPDDVITCQYRETGVFQQRGFTLKDFMSQLVASRNDPGKGRNIPVHYSGKQKTGVHAVASTLETQIPHAVGAAYAFKMEAKENPTETSEGDFHGALNMAATQDCPVIFICRNNGFAISTPTSEQYCGDGIASRGIGYGIDALRVDGTDIFAVYEATKEARRRALQDGGRPILIEFMSYRVSHHSTSDDSFAYRSKGEIESWKTGHNPLSLLLRWLENNGLCNETMEKETRLAIRKAVLAELTVAESEQKLALRAVFDDVYAELSEEQLAQKEELRRIMMTFPDEYDVESHEGGLAGL
ncbi:putative 2-oxoisovalerate dehydrogenase alpha subunit [Leptodontidium sp. 2 PMI_412]|nr:putative 2-oxoisovalerate dehydrogenase alpha subunit [Leptodontidium sp. 2 PMI_412]